MHLPSLLPDPLVALGRRAQDVNYDRRVYARQHTAAHGVSYRTYGVVAPRFDLLRSFLLAFAAAGDVVVDAGANIGTYALPAAVAGCHVHAFEPDPRAYDRLVANATANHFDTGFVTPYRIGLSDTTGTRTLHCAPQSTLSSYQPTDTAHRNGQLVTTRVERLDELVETGALPAPDHLKVDVEGHEAAVLHGAAETIRAARPTIYVEIHDAHHETESVTGTLFAWLQDADYSVARFGHRWVAFPTTVTDYTETTTGTITND